MTSAVQRGFLALGSYCNFAASESREMPDAPLSDHAIFSAPSWLPPGAVRQAPSFAMPLHIMI